ncbi:MAG TPA: protein translocase subunit SecF, partial [Nitrosospira sp.]
MEFFRIKRDIPFMSWGKYTTAISLLTFIAAVFFLYAKGLNLGVDFTGGTVMEVGYSQPADINEIRSRLVELGMPDVSVQNFGTSRDVLIRLPARPEMSSARLSETVITALHQDDKDAEMRRVEFVGPQVGQELVESGALALLIVSLGIIGYLA